MGWGQRIIIILFEEILFYLLDRCVLLFMIFFFG